MADIAKLSDDLFAMNSNEHDPLDSMDDSGNSSASQFSASMPNLNATAEDIVFAFQLDHMDDAAHFRMLFEYIQMGFIDGVLTFDANGIQYANINGIKTIGHEFSIRGADISYFYNSSMPLVRIGINLGAFAKVTKNVGKKHSLLIFHVRNECVLRYEIMSMLVGGKSSNARGMIPIKQVDYENVVLPEKGNLIMSVPISTFCGNCTILSNTAPIKQIRVVCNEAGFKFQAINNADEIVTTQPFYPGVLRIMQGFDCTSLEVHKNTADAKLGRHLLTINIDRIIMKWMRKMINIPSISDRIRVYVSTSGKHVIFECNLARYGTVSTYLS